MRLIDADAFLERIRKDPLFPLVERYGLSRVIENEPTVDAIPVDWLKKYVLIEGAYMSEAKRKEREIAKKLLKEYHESQHLEIR